MRKPVEIDRIVKTSTPVPEDITGMLAKLGAWKPKTLEQVVTVGERLIHAANEAIFSSATRTDDGKKRSYFKQMQNKMIKYPNGIRDSREYLYIDSVEFSTSEWDTCAKLSGIRLSKYNRIGNNTLQEYTLPVMFGNIVDMDETSVTILANGYRVTYEIVNDYEEYENVYNRIHAITERATRSVSKYFTRDMCKVSLTKKPFTKRGEKDDNKVEAKTNINQRGKQCQIQRTSTKASRGALKSAEVPSDTTSSSPATMASGTDKNTRRKHVSAILVRRSSKKSSTSSKST